METTREPYEFMVRWIPAGVPDNQYAGTVQAQINFAYVTRDGETVVSWNPDPKGPFHVALSGPDGIPLGDVIPSLNAAVLAEIGAKTAALAAKETELQSVIDAKNTTDASLAEVQQQIADLQAQIVELTPPEEPAIQPVSRMQALLALHDAGLLDQVNAIVAQADPRTRLAWETATDFHRTSPTIAALWAALGKSEAELDALFAAAKLIEV